MNNLFNNEEFEISFEEGFGVILFSVLFMKSLNAGMSVFFSMFGFGIVYLIRKVLTKKQKHL